MTHCVGKYQVHTLHPWYFFYIATVISVETLRKSLPMKPYSFILALMVLTCACQKSLQDNQGQKLRPLSSDSVSLPGDSAAIPPFPLQTINNSQAGGSPAPGCPVLPLYGDSLIFPQPTAGDNIVQPVNAPGPGTYFAWPAGMVLDRNTGAIDLTRSQSGMRYAIGFVPNGTTDTCISTLIIAGAAYFDSVYVLGDNDTLAKPYFNADGDLTNICSTPGACSFDYDGQAAAKGVFVDPATGVIQLSKTINGKGQLKGLFGSVPKNGSTAIVNISYKLNDGSNDAPQQIAVQFEYYDAQTAISPGLVNNMEAKSFNAQNDKLISTSINPRPPIIIITHKH